ncbi:MAG: transglycosylase domain-containing protein [Bacteroidetes bacterium]|nr:transglycosylase domain-containing protein [Bacteroidota bacterium]
MNNSLNLRNATLWCAAGLLAFILLCLVLRNPVLRAIISSKINRLNTGYNADLKISKARFEGVSTVFLTCISLKPVDGDSLLRIDTLVVSVNPWKLLAGRLNISSVEIRNLYLMVSRKDSLTNYNFLLKPMKTLSPADSTVAVNTVKDTALLTGTTDYSEAANRIFRWVFDKIPGETDIANLNIRSTTNSHLVNMHLDRFLIEDHAFSTNIRIREDSLEAVWKAAGRLDSRNRFAEAVLSSTDNRKISLPYIGFKWNASFCFDSLKFSLLAGSFKNDEAGVKGSIAFKGLQVFHKMIAADTVKFQKLGVDFLLNFETDAIELDSATEVNFNDLDFHPYFKYRSVPSRQVSIKINKPPFPAQQLFSSLPEGLFANLKGIETSGELSYYLDFFVDLSVPDSLRFDMELKRQKFRVNSYGRGGLLKLDSSFLYTAYEDGEPVRTFSLGPENPNFRKISQISPFLQNAVMTSEDGGFYLHRGFLPDAFRESIIANIKEGRFVRGGSTISMQLVKNVFLSRNKTIARKLEEALIVWLIENQQLCSKDRMYEVYLNIIEWGPLIYGANEASRFYFNKDASKLTLAEAIFMASIIPRPKWFKYNFEENGHLRGSMADYYRLVSSKMLNKGWITQQDFNRLVPDVELKGPARLMLKDMKNGEMVK